MQLQKAATYPNLVIHQIGHTFRRSSDTDTLLLDTSYNHHSVSRPPTPIPIINPPISFTHPTTSIELMIILPWSGHWPEMMSIITWWTGAAVSGAPPQRPRWRSRRGRWRTWWVLLGLTSSSGGSGARRWSGPSPAGCCHRGRCHSPSYASISSSARSSPARSRSWTHCCSRSRPFLLSALEKTNPDFPAQKTFYLWKKDFFFMSCHRRPWETRGFIQSYTRRSTAALFSFPLRKG